MVLDWDAIKEIITYSSVPVILKGVLNAEDAMKAIEVGAKAIVVSNHGGRQNDSAIATLKALAALPADIRNKIEVYLDGGIRSGAAVFKALALGARAVLIGRPALYGLAVNGKDGLLDVLNILTNELKDIMKSAGCDSVQHISREMIKEN